MQIIDLSDNGTNDINPNRPSHAGGQYTHILIKNRVGGSTALSNKPVINANPSGNTLSTDNRSNVISPATIIQSSIMLPIPDQLVFNYGAEWSADDAGITSQTLTALRQGTTDLSQALKQGSAGIENLTQNFIQSTAGRRVSQATGETFNPNRELLYSAPTLRSFPFTWQFAFRNRKQVTTFDRFTQIMLEHMHPEFVNQRNGVWRVPDTFEVSFENVKTRKINVCVLTSFSIDDTASGAGFKSFSDGSPSHRSVSMTFQEISPLVRQDIVDGF